MGCRILTSPRLGPTHCRRRALSPIGHVQRPIAQRAGLLREKGACAASGTLVRRRGWGLPTVGGEPSRRSGMSRALSPRGLGSYERRGVCGIWHAGSSPRLGPTHCRRRAPSPIGHVQRPIAQRAGLLRAKAAVAAGEQYGCPLSCFTFRKVHLCPSSSLLDPLAVISQARCPCLARSDRKELRGLSVVGGAGPGSSGV